MQYLSGNNNAAVDTDDGEVVVKTTGGKTLLKTSGMTDSSKNPGTGTAKTVGGAKQEGGLPPLPEIPLPNSVPPKDDEKKDEKESDNTVLYIVGGGIAALILWKLL